MKKILLLLALLSSSCDEGVQTFSYKKVEEVCEHINTYHVKYMICTNTGLRGEIDDVCNYGRINQLNNCIYALLPREYCNKCESYTKVDTTIYCGTYQIVKY